MANLQNVGRTPSGPLNVPAIQGDDATNSRPLSGQDLMTSLQGKTFPGALPSPITAAGAEKPKAVTSPTGNKDLLLNLLNRPNSSKPAASITGSHSGSTKADEGGKLDPAVDSLRQSFAEASFEAPQPTRTNMFNYANPFDQLHASSPLNRTPQPEVHAPQKNFEILKHNRDALSIFNGESGEPAAKSRKLTSPAPSSTPAADEKSQSVSEALEGVGEKVDKEVTQALKEADAQEKGLATGKPAPADTGDNAADEDSQIKKETEADNDDVESSWESAEDEEAGKSEDYKVEVYNFPMKPFVSIQIKDMDTARPIRQDYSMVIAKLRKDFDQIDRCLVTATQTHIVYAQVATKKDNGGFRIIHQDTGAHKQVFRSSGERIFSVQLCNTVVPGSDVEAILGTGANGSIFWTSVSKSRGELFADDDVEAVGFIMPAVATPDEQTSGSPVKTRAKMSSRHPEYFGVARGKQIHLISSEKVKDWAYCDAKTRKVNSEKYMAEHGLKIMTGKAGKDFCFSEDDTMIVSLDKSGRFKFWDIKDLTSRACDAREGKHDAVELREPVWSLSAAASGSRPDEKPSVSSIMFLDKERPTVKGVALRYVLIGFKQNHILQLWDLGLSKAVQEIRLPHGKDSDGICSITYHPRSGIVALGHPTRNSIYFIHLSAPKYNIGPMDQARYINLLARGDPTLPRPESTAIMSGLREFSLAKFGQLRSLDMLRQPVENASDPDSDDATLFELYVMHSKGVVGISIKRKDLGWDKDSKMVHPIDAVQEGIIDVKELVQPQRLTEPSEQSSNAGTPSKQISKPAVTKKQDPVKPSTVTTGKNEAVKREPASAPAPAVKDATRRETTPERGSMQIPEAPLPSQQHPSNPPLMTPDSYAMAAQRAKSPTREKAVKDAANAVKKVIISPTATAAAPHVSSNDDLEAKLKHQFDALYQRIDADKRVQDAAGSARQDAILRLVSSTLGENVEGTLNHIVSGSIESRIIPHLTDSTSRIVEKTLSDTLPPQLNASVSREVKTALPGGIQQALRDQQFQRAITDQVATKVQQQVSQLLQQAMPNIATQATQKMVSDLENRTKQQLQEAHTRRQQDDAKIEELSKLVRSLSETMQNMSESQAAFQEQVLKMQSQSTKTDTEDGATKDEEASTSAAADPQAEAEAQEVKKITQLLVDGEFDAATIEVSFL